ncbi:MAG: ATP-binding protein [Phormidesmis sp.]
MSDTASRSETQSLLSASAAEPFARHQSFWRRLKVSKRITLGFSVALGVMFAGTGTGILVGNLYQHDALEIETQVQEEIELLSQLQAGVLQARTHQQQLIPLSAFPEDFQDEYNHILKHAETINDVLQDIDNYFLAASEHEKLSEMIDVLRLSKFIDVHASVPKIYLKELDQLVNSIDVESLSTPTQVEAAQAKLLAFTNSELAILFDGVSDDLSGIIQAAREDLVIARQQAQSASQLRNWIISLSMIVSSAIGALLALLISRSISTPLKTVEKTAIQITRNDNFDLRVDVMGEDEVGTVAAAFNLMIERVNDLLHEQTVKTKALEESNQQLISTQKQMIEQEKLASLGSLTAGIAHEIKNPLNFVNNFAELSVELTEELFEELAPQKEQLSSETFEDLTEILEMLKSNVSKIEHHGKRADKIVANMLQHSRSGDSEWSDVNLNELVADAINLAYHGMRAKHSDFNLTFDNDYDDSIGTVRVSVQSLSRVFLNLVNNACYAIYQRQLIEDDAFKPLLKIRTRKTNDDTVSVWIRDNGTGMSAEVKEKVFEQFFTTKPTGEGTGLGLSLSYNIVVEQHKGTLQVESEEGIYTDFIVTLPISQETV